MAVGPGPEELEGIVGRDQFFTFEHTADEFHLAHGERGEVGHGTLAGLLPFSPRLPQQHGWRGGAVGNDIDVHGCNILYSTILCKIIKPLYMGAHRKTQYAVNFNAHNILALENSPAAGVTSA